MDLMSFLWSLTWDALKNRLLAQGIEPYQLEWVDFHDMDQLNKLAEKIVPWLIKKNPNMANLIKQNANLAWDKKDEVVEVINKI